MPVWRSSGWSHLPQTGLNWNVQITMKRQILFIQGGGEGAHKADKVLVDALGRALGSAYDLRYPMMPQESDPDYQRWRTTIGKELEALADGAIVIGHSLGASFLLKYLSEEIVGKIIAGLFLIATPYWGGRGWRYEGYERVALREDVAKKLPRSTPVYL